MSRCSSRSRRSSRRRRSVDTGNISLNDANVVIQLLEDKRRSSLVEVTAIKRADQAVAELLKEIADNKARLKAAVFDAGEEMRGRLGIDDFKRRRGRRPFMREGSVTRSSTSVTSNDSSMYTRRRRSPSTSYTSRTTSRTTTNTRSSSIGSVSRGERKAGESVVRVAAKTKPAASTVEEPSRSASSKRAQKQLTEVIKTYDNVINNLQMATTQLKTLSFEPLDDKLARNFQEVNALQETIKQSRNELAK